MDPRMFLHLRPPYLHSLAAADAATCDALWELQRAAPQLAVRLWRGSKMQTEADLFDEIAAACQFPYYFGANWNALDECLADLEWLPGEGYLFCITDSQRLLGKAPGQMLTSFVGLLEKLAGEWSKPRIGGVPRPARPFHVLWQYPEKEAAVWRQRFGHLAKSWQTLSLQKEG